MNRFLLIRIILGIAFLQGTFYAIPAKASHTMGADLTYQCLGGNTYKVTVSFYRDCIGIAAPTNPFVTITSASCAQSLGVTCYPRAGTGQEVTPTCSSAVTTCNGGSFTGIQEWVYDGIVTLPMQCTDWRFGYSLCCRNAAITTINTPSTSTFYIYATLNNVITPCNSSPTFSNKPVPFLCLGQQFCFNHGAYDADGDSLAYSLITPLQTATTPVTYLAPYNAANPLNSSPATAFNTATGDICLTPQALEVTVMAVLVKEYRNGVLIGTVERDIQITVMNCNNNLPSLSGINGTNNFSMTICANEATCFNIFSSDPDSGQTLTVDWNNGIPGGTFTTGPGVRPTSVFCWTPSSSDIGRTFTFTATVRDDACPYRGSQTYSYTITVIGIRVNAGPDQAIACSDLATLTANASGGGPYTYLWSNGSTMQSITVGAGTYIVTASNGSCSARDTVVVTMPYIPIAAFTNSTTACSNTPVTFTDQSTTTGGAIWYWNWTFGDGTSSLQQNPTHTYSGPGTYTVTLIVENTLGCRDSISHTVVIASPPVASFNWTGTCVGSTISFNNTSTGNPTSWNWTFGDGTSSTAQNPTHVYTNPGTYPVTLVTGSLPGCTGTITQNVVVNPLPLISADADQSVCAGNSVTINATGGTTYTWSNGSTGTPLIFNPSGTTTLIVTGTSSSGCINTDTVTVISLPLPTVNAGADRFVCNGSSVTLTATGATSYNWIPGGSGGSITVQPSTGTTYTVIGTDAIGCTASDIVDVNVGTLPITNAGPDADICAGASASLTATGGGTYSWNPTGSSNGIISVSPSLSTNYTVTVTDGNGCSATDVARVNVHAAPVVNLQNSFLCSGSTLTLNAGNPGSTYSWSTGATSQTIVVSSGGTYSVVVTNPYGCSTTASSTVTSGSNITINLANVSFCQGDSAILDAGYSGMSYAWTPGGQTTQTITIQNAGTYGVTVSDPAGCTGSISVTALVKPLPTPNFGAASVCQGSSTYFTNGSTITSGSITAWNWNFGNGTTGSVQNPSVVYGAPGIYSVTLTTTSSGGCSASMTSSITVNPNPVANFSVSNGCVNSSIQFTDQSTVSVGNIVSYAWNFGDSTASINPNPAHTYTANGNYTITLTVTTAGGCVQSTTRTINVFPLPVPDFSSPVVCQGTATSFTNNTTISTGAVTSYQWVFNNSATSSQNSPSYTFPSAGVFPVQLTATSNYNCSASIIRSVTINALPIANAGPDQTICAGSSATLTATGGATYSWMPGGMATSNITVSPSTATSYTVTVTNADGCSTTDVADLVVNQRPNINAGTDKTICQGQSVTLNATGGVSYNWMPGNLTGNSITIQPTATTTYVLIGTGPYGCTNTDTVLVTVNPIPSINAGPDPSICLGSTISLTATGATSYVWNPIGGNVSTVLVTPVVTTSYTVIGTNASGCTNSDTITVTVNPVPVVSMTPTFVCAGSSTSLDAGNPGSNYHWSTGETGQSINVNDSGNFTVVVTNPFGCSALGTAVVTLAGTISQVPTSTSICSGQTATLNAGNPGSTYQWNTGPTTSTINVTTGGNYYVTVTDVNGCAATLLYTVAVNPLPVVNFTAPGVCFGNNVNFTNGTTVSAGSIASYVWNFGDQFSGGTQNPLHLYTNSGTYAVTLTATTQAGCSASANRNVTVNPLPIAEFSATEVCLGNTTAFTNSSSISVGTISSYIWNLGDNFYTFNQQPNHIYTASGSYPATLQVISAAGCSDTTLHMVIVNDLPVVAFSLSNACAGTPIQLTNNTNSSTGIQSMNWDLGNGTSSTNVNPVASYSVAGNYQLTLSVTDSNGCVNTASKFLSIAPLPVADFSVTPECVNNSSSILDNSSIPTGSINSHYWSFGNGTISNQVQPTINYNTPGTFEITLIVTSNLGCSDTISRFTDAYPLPQLNFATADACFGNTTSFTNNSTVGYGTIASYQWNFGDQTISSSPTPSHVYSTAGTYNVILTAVTNNGCRDSALQIVNIFPNPVANFTTTSVCFGSPTQFLNQSFLSGGGQLSSFWNFSDGGTSSANNPPHTFTSPGGYNISLSVITSHGCVDSILNGMSVYRNPVARFASVNGCMGNTVQFTDQSYSQDGSINVWLWEFGDGGSSIEGNPAHNYQSVGNYNVALTTTTIYGCVARYGDTVDIYSLPPVAIQAGNACINTPIQFSNTAGNTGSVNYSWDLGNGYQSVNNNFTYAYANSGTYTVTLTAQSVYGCRNSVNTRVSVYPEPTPSFSTNNVCQASTAVFINNSSIPTGTIRSYNWNFGDNQTSATANPSHTYSSTGNYTVILTAVSDQGCTAVVNQPLRVHPLPVVSFGSSYQGCTPVIANFANTSTILNGTIAGYLWDFGDGGVSNDSLPQHTYSNTGLYNVTMTAVSDQGCYASATIPGLVRVLPQPVADFIADPMVTDIQMPVVHFQNQSSLYNTYQWIFGDGTTTSTELNPVHTFRDTGTYSALLITTNSFGCRDTILKYIEIRPHSTLFIPNCFTPNGDGKNDDFKPFFTNMTDIQVWIFDRWGKLLTNWDSLEGSWDGYYQGRKCETDTYVYKIIGNGIDGKHSEWVGHVSIVY